MRLYGNKYATVPAYICFDEIGAENPTSAIDDTVADSMSHITVTAFGNNLSVSGIADDYSLRIFSIDGILRKHFSLAGATAVSISDLASGTYIAEIITATGQRHTVRFLKH